VVPLPYAHPGARAAFYVVLGLFLVCELRVRVRSRLDQRGSHEDRHSYWLVYFSVVIGMGVGFALASVHGTAIRGGRWPIFFVGLLLMSAGIVIRQWAVLLLGRYFTTDVRVHDEQTVIERGPYRWVRHPAYSGLLLTLAGIGLALGSWAALAAMVLVPAIGLVYRIRVEEAALSHGLGEPYRRFVAGRARLVPHVW
jgi:protein-S-isoprenylcysteine O-methyltransferase Ste14